MDSNYYLIKFSEVFATWLIDRTPINELKLAYLMKEISEKIICKFEMELLREGPLC